MLRDQSGNGVFIDHLLLAVAFQNHDKIVKSADNTAHLKAIGQENRGILSLLAQRAQHPIL